MRLFEKKIRTFKRKQNAIFAGKHLLLSLIITMLIIAVFWAVFSIFEIPSSELFLFALTCKILLIMIVLYQLLLLNRTLLSDVKAARLLDRLNKDEHDTFQNALELVREKKSPNAILEKIYARADEYAGVNKTEPDWTGFNLIKVWFILILGGFLTIYIIANSSFLKAYDFFRLQKLPPKEHKLFVELNPGNLSLTRNSDVTLEVVNPDPGVEHRLFYRIEKNWREERIFDYKRKFTNLDYSFSYYIETPYARSDTFRIDIFEMPTVKRMDLRLDYPEYTGLSSEFMENSTGNIKALEGTRATLTIVTNNPVELADMVFADGNLQNLTRLGRDTFKTQITIKRNGSYHINLLDFLGNRSQKIERFITAIPDQNPEIRILYPARDTLLNQNLLLPLKIFASDDFGLQNLKLKYFVNSEEIDSLQIMNKITGSTVELNYDFNLTSRFLIPGDRVTYWVEISDNSPAGKTAASRRYIARFPSIEEIYQEIERSEQEKSEILKNTLERSRELQEDVEEKRRELMRKEEFDWQDKKEIEDFLKKQEDLNTDIEQVVNDYEELIDKMEQNQALSRETLEKMEKIRELMDEISNDQLLDAMEKLQKSLEDLDPEVMKKAMEDFKFSLDDFSEKLDQTIDLLEKIKKEQALQKSLEIAEEMEEMQKELNRKTSEGDTDLQNLAEEQQNISDKLESLKEQLEQTKDFLKPEKDDELIQKMEELQSEIDKNGLSEDLQNSKKNLEQNNPSEAQQNQCDAASKMASMTGKLDEMMQMMSSGSMMEMGDMLDKTISRLLLFSRNHEKSSAEYFGDPFEILPAQIAIFEGLNLSLRELYSVPMIALVIGPKFIYDANYTNSVYRELFQHINDAGSHKVKPLLEDVQKGLNIMIFDLLQAKNNMQSGGGGGMQSLMKALQQMGQQQMLISMMTQQMFMQMGQDGKLDRDMMAQAQRLARDEERLAENLKRLLQNDPDAQKQTSTMNKIIEDLESISRNLKRGNINQDLIDQQERILSRLLDAQKSIHKREFSKKRKAEQSEIDIWELPEDIKLRFDKLRQKALLKEDYKKYSKEYQALIKEYLKILNEKANIGNPEN